MSKYGLKIAKEYGEKLQSFYNKEDAERYFDLYRNNAVDIVEKIIKSYDNLKLDYSVESLKNIEKLYFELYENNEFSKMDITKNEFENIMEIYFGEVITRNYKDSKWLVYEYPFSRGKYELHVNKGLGSISVVGMCKDLNNRKDNKRKNYLFNQRKYLLID